MRYATIYADSGQKLGNFVENFLRRKDVVSRILTINTIRSWDLSRPVRIYCERKVLICWFSTIDILFHVSSIFGTILDFVGHFIFVLKLILTLRQQNND